MLAYCDNAGQLGMLVNCYGKDSGGTENVEDVEMVERDEGKSRLPKELIE